MSQSHEVLLVVYAVLWAGILPTFRRLRAFAVNELFGRKPTQEQKEARARAARRVTSGVLVGDAAPAVLLAFLLRWFPESCGFWGFLAGGLAGVSAVIFPRLLHALLAAEGNWKRHYSPDEWLVVLEDWDRSSVVKTDSGLARNPAFDKSVNRRLPHYGAGAPAGSDPRAWPARCLCCLTRLASRATRPSFHWSGLGRDRTITAD